MARVARKETPRHRQGSRGSRIAPAGDFAEECLALLARILIFTGHSPESLWRQFRAICQRFKQPTRRFDPGELNYVADLPQVITSWYTDADYLDHRGQPIALPLRTEQGPSLCALIERALPREDPTAVVESLTKMRGVRRRGSLYVPTARYCIYPKDSSRLHGLSTLLGMLQTVEHNIGAATADKLLERSAKNPNFPARVLPAFYKRLTPAVEGLLEEFDGEMQKEERTAEGGPRTRLRLAFFVSRSPVSNDTRRRRHPARKRAGPRNRRGGKRR